MKLILKREVDNLGLPGDVVDVADGYGRNYLVPRGMAILATPGAMKEAEALTRSRKAHESKTLGDAEASRTILESRTLRIASRVDDRGHLYGSVSAADVARVLKERGHEIPRKRIELRGTIKEIGSYEVPVHVHPQVTATITVEVVDAEGRVYKDASGVSRIVGEEPPAPSDEVAVLTEQALEAAEELEAHEAEADAAPSPDDAPADPADAPEEA
jgi:large subunit ribosomal protein L9